MKRLMFFFIVFISFWASCSITRPNSVFPSAGKAAKVNNEGTMFGLNENDAPFVDSADSVNLYLSARGVQDKAALEAMIKSNRVVFLPVGSLVDVIENDENKSATKVRIRSGENIGREMWTHPKFISSIN